MKLSNYSVKFPTSTTYTYSRTYGDIVSLMGTIISYIVFININLYIFFKKLMDNKI